MYDLFIPKVENPLQRFDFSKPSLMKKQIERIPSSFSLTKSLSRLQSLNANNIEPDSTPIE